MGDVLRHAARVGGATVGFLAPADADPTAPPDALLLHGIPASAELLRGAVAAFAARGVTAFAPDLVGYGTTDVPESADHSLRGSADLLAAFVQQLGGAPWLVGHDLGGGVAQLMAAHHPRSLSGLTLGDTVVGDSWPVRPVRVMRALARAGGYVPLATVGGVTNPWTSWELRQGFADTGFPAAHPDDVARVFWDGKVADPLGRRRFARHLVALDPAQTTEVVPALARVTVPTALVWADTDRFQSWEVVGARLAAALPAPKVTLVADAGHFVPLERTDAWVDALLATGPI